LITTFDIIILIIAGGLGGLLSGLLGVGGGVVYVVILTHYFEKLQLGNIEQVRFILSNSFFAILFSSLIGSYQQIKLKNFYLREVLLTASTAVVSWIIVTLLIINFDWYSKEVFTIIFIILLIASALKMFLTSKNGSNNVYKDILPKKTYPIVGIFTGFFSALSGLGGGVITVPALSDIMKLKIRKATSISLGVIPFLAAASFILYALASPQENVSSSLGYLNPKLVIPMVLGGLFTAPIGVRLSNKLSEKTTRLYFVLLLLIVSVRMLFTFFSN
jgi:uncharacterized membrane protein YfcA